MSLISGELRVICLVVPLIILSLCAGSSWSPEYPVKAAAINASTSVSSLAILIQSTESRASNISA